MATISSPHSWAMSTVFPYKDLEGTRMQLGHLMPKGQAQVSSLSHVTQRQDKMCYSSFFAFGIGDGKILSPCSGKSSELGGFVWFF